MNPLCEFDVFFFTWGFQLVRSKITLCQTAGSVYSERPKATETAPVSQTLFFFLQTNNLTCSTNSWKFYSQDLKGQQSVKLKCSGPFICLSQLCSRCLWVTDCGQQTGCQADRPPSHRQPHHPCRCTTYTLPGQHPVQLQTGTTNQSNITPPPCQLPCTSYRSTQACMQCTTANTQEHKHFTAAMWTEIRASVALQ